MPFIHYPAPIQWRRDVCNVDVNGRGMYPSAAFLAKCVAAENHLTAHRHKEVFSCDWRLDPAQGGGGGGFAGTTNLRHFRFRSSHGATRLRAMVGIGKTDGGTSPQTSIDVTLSGGGTTTMGPWISARDDVNKSDAPDHISWAVSTIAIDPDSIYECVLISEDFGRVLGVSVAELGDPTPSESTLYYNQSTPQAGAPLLDADRSRLIVGVDAMLRANGGTIVHWGIGDGTARTRSSSTYINLIDDATTGAPTTATPGHYLDVQYRRTASRTTVPFEIAVYGEATVGSGGHVAIVDASNNVLATVTVDGAAGWYTATGSLPTTPQKFDLQYRSASGADEIDVYGVSVQEWEA